MSQGALQYEASDSWLLLSIIVAAGDDAAGLEEIVSVGDAINHAIFTDDEMESGLYRLSHGGYIEEVKGRFRPSNVTLEKYKEISQKKKVWLGQTALLREFIGAQPWVFGVPFPRPENKYKYPGFTKEKFAIAVENYQRKAWKIIKELTKK